MEGGQLEINVNPRDALKISTPVVSIVATAGINSLSIITSLLLALKMTTLVSSIVATIQPKTVKSRSLLALETALLNASIVATIG